MRRWVALWFVLVALLSLAPLSLKNSLGTTGVFHYVGHVCIFALCGVMALADVRIPLSRLRRVALVFLFCASLEGLEALIYGNSFEWLDLLVDWFGVALAPLLLFLGAAFDLEKKM